MLSNYKILTAVLLLFFSIVSVGAGQTQSKTAVEPVPKPKFGNGVLEEVSGAMERLLQLKWDGHNLALKRDWDTKSKKKNKKLVSKKPSMRLRLKLVQILWEARVTVARSSCISPVKTCPLRPFLQRMT